MAFKGNDDFYDELVKENIYGTGKNITENQIVKPIGEKMEQQAKEALAKAEAAEPILKQVEEIAEAEEAAEAEDEANEADEANEESEDN